MIEAKPDILSIMEREGLELRQRGGDYWAPCPFHSEKTPSFKVSPVKQSFYCFGCGEHGDAIDFIQKHHNVNFKEALSILGIRSGKPSPPDQVKEHRRRLLKAYEAWKQARYQSLCRESIDLHSLQIIIKKRLPQDERLAWLYAETISRLPGVDYRLDILAGDDLEDIYSLYCEDA